MSRDHVPANHRGANPNLNPNPNPNPNPIPNPNPRYHPSWEAWRISGEVGDPLQTWEEVRNFRK